MSATSTPAFTFGQNWLAYSRLLDPERLEDAQRSLATLLDRRSLDGCSFVDVGAGSGLFSIAAVRLGAQRVVALDRDQECLAAVAGNAARFLDDSQRARLEVQHGDALASHTLPAASFDVVYAWGSLHHSGAMWCAVANAAGLCAPGGRFALALYNRTWFYRAWRLVKQAYHRSPMPLRLLMAAGMAAPRAVVRVARGRRPFRLERGMNIWYDSLDWLGGVPYEAATASEVIARLQTQGFQLERSCLTRRHGCNEFVFRLRSRSGAA